MDERAPLGSPGGLRGESVTPKASKMLRCFATVLCAILLVGRWMSKASKTEGRGFWLCHVDVEAVVDAVGLGPAQVLLFASSFASCYSQNVAEKEKPLTRLFGWVK